MGKKRASLLPKATKKRIVVLVAIYIITTSLAYFVGGFFLFEWIISFLPYVLLINCMLLFFLYFQRNFFREKKERIYIQLIVVSILIVTVVLGARFFQFVAVAPATGNGVTPFTLAFLNKNHLNRRYAVIDHATRTLQPDLLGVVELEPIDQGKIPFLLTFPYTQRLVSDDHFSIALFSKYPLERIPLNQERLKHVLAARVSIKNTAYYVFVLHLFPPMDSWTESMRDNELYALMQYVETIPTDNVILLGDFNISPWSPVYAKHFSRSEKIVNAAKGRGLFFTWGHWFIRSHIDYIFVSKSAFIESFQEKYIEGSDHNLIWTKVRL